MKVIPLFVYPKIYFVKEMLCNSNYAYTGALIKVFMPMKVIIMTGLYKYKTTSVRMFQVAPL